MKKLLLYLRYLMVAFGIGAVTFIILSFTDLPYYAYHHLGTKNASMELPPDYIVVLGAGGMPSPEGLMRCTYAAEAARAYPNSKVVVAMPTKPEYFLVSHTYKMFKEIELRGIDSSRFVFQMKGMNTREQAIAIANDLPQHDTLSLMMVTSPQHVYRSIKAFEKAGFGSVGGMASFEKAVAEENLIDPGAVKEQVTNLNLRYNMWNYMKYQIIVAREYVAITYYWLKGWI